jgi:hypothetical protein
MADGSWPNNPESFPGGPTALAAWALLESGVSPDDARLAKALAWLETLKTDKTYTISIRANVWAAASRQSSGLIASASPPSGSIASASPPSGKYDKLLERDVARLYHNTCGSYSYDIKAETICDIGDQSNGHYAVLGVEAGLGRKIEIPKEYWRTVERYWLSVQNPDGGWPYSRQGTPSSATMTAAGVCAMQLCNNQLQDAASASAIQKGLGWMDKNFRQSIKDPSMMYYYFLAVQRMGWLTGKSEIGGVKWAPAMEQELLSRQNKDGSWVGPWGTDVSTAYAILVLGRHP